MSQGCTTIYTHSRAYTLHPFVFFHRYSHLNMPVFFHMRPSYPENLLKKMKKKCPSCNVRESEKTISDPSLYPFIQIHTKCDWGLFWTENPSDAQVSWKVSSAVCVQSCWQTNQPTDKKFRHGWKYNLLGEGKNGILARVCSHANSRHQAKCSCPIFFFFFFFFFSYFFFFFGISNQVSRIHPLGTIATKFYGNPSNNYWGISGQKQTPPEPQI